MLAYIIRRSLQAIPTVLGVLFILFVLFFAVADPTDIAAMALGEKAQQEQIDEWVKSHGYAEPKFYNAEAEGLGRFTETRIANYYQSMLTFNFGNSDLDEISITRKIKEGVKPSLYITVPIFLFSLLLSVGISLVVALFRGTYIDHSALVLCVLGMSIVVFVYIIGGQYLFGKVLRWFPISGWSDPHALHFLILPVLIGVIEGMGSSVRFYRTIMVNEISSDYIRTARAKGVSDRSLLGKHLLKNAMIPILTGVVMRIPFLFTGSLLLESFFGIPGLGRLTVDAIFSNDFRTISAMVYIGSLLYIFANLLTDISYTLVDPRVRLK